MSFLPSSDTFRLGDTWHCSDGKRVHAFYLKLLLDGSQKPGPDAGGIGHAVSEDLIHWEELPDAVEPGGVGSYDDLDIWTGCTVYTQGKFYLFYTSRSSEGPEFSFSLAISEDGIRFKKYDGNPLFTPDERIYFGENHRCRLRMHGNGYPGALQYDLRDLCVQRENPQSPWYGFFAARVPADEIPKTAVIGLAVSQDLLHWEQRPPCFAPDRYHVIETPDVFQMNGKWYMLCLTGNVYGQRHCVSDSSSYDRATIYAVADRIDGPYRETENNALLVTKTASGACAKTVLHNGQRYMFYTEVLEDPIGHYEQYMSLPKPLAADGDGTLRLKWYPLIERLYTNEALPLIRSAQIENDGRFGTPGKWEYLDNAVRGSCETDWCLLPFAHELKDFAAEAVIERQTAESAGFAFDLGDSVFGGGYQVILDYKYNKVILAAVRTFSTLDERDYPLQERQHALKVLVTGNTVEIYLNDDLVLHHLIRRKGGHFAFYLEKGQAAFSSAKLHAVEI